MRIGIFSVLFACSCDQTEPEVVEPIGETVLEEEDVAVPAEPIPEPVPVLVPANTKLLIDYMMGNVRGKRFVKPIRQESRMCDPMWGVVHIIGGHHYTLYYCIEDGQSKQLTVYDVSGRRNEAASVFTVNADGVIMYAHGPSEEYCASKDKADPRCGKQMYMPEIALVNDAEFWQNDWIKLNDRLIAFYEGR